VSRLVTIQGPTQLLCALAVLAWEDAQGTAQTFDDYLVVHGLAADFSGPILEATRALARVRRWKAIVDLSDLDDGIASTPDATARIHARVGLSEVDAIYIARNWQPSNEMLLGAYKNAEKIVYGDGFGLVDSFHWPGFVTPDRAKLCIPIEYEFGILDRIPYEIIPRRYLEAVIQQFVQATPEVTTYTRELAAWMGHDAVLLAGANTVEGQWIADVNTQVALSVEHVLRYVRRGQKIVIKAHPREFLGQSELTRRLLEDEHGFPAIVVSGMMAAIPVEILCRVLGFSGVISLTSASAVSLKYLYGMQCHVADDDLTLPKLQCTSQSDLESMNDLRLWRAKLDGWDGKGIVHRHGPENPWQRLELAQAINLLNRGNHTDALALFEGLRRAGCNAPQVAYGRAAALLGQGETIRGLLALRPLRGDYYSIAGSRLIEMHPRARFIRNAARRIRNSFRRLTRPSPNYDF